MDRHVPVAIGVAACREQLIAHLRFFQSEEIAIERSALFEIGDGNSNFESIQAVVVCTRQDDKFAPLAVRILR